MAQVTTYNTFIWLTLRLFSVPYNHSMAHLHAPPSIRSFEFYRRIKVISQNHSIFVNTKTLSLVEKLNSFSRTFECISNMRYVSLLSLSPLEEPTMLSVGMENECNSFFMCCGYLRNIFYADHIG